jgi:hypothetical protein
MRLRSLAVFTIGVSFCVQALGEPPAVLDRVPAEAALVVVTRNMRAAQEHAAPLVKLMEGRDAPLREPKESLDRFLAAPGVKADGSLAIVMPKAPPAPDPDAMEDAGEEPAFVILVQVSDYAAFVSNLGGDPKAEMANVRWDDMAGFVRQLDGFAVLGKDEQTVRGYSSQGQMRAHLSRLSQAGVRVVDRADVVMIVDAQAFRERIQQAPINRAGMAGGLPVNVAGLTGPLGSMRDALARDGAISVIGWTGGESGQALDFVAVFRQGSEMANLCTGGEDSGSLMARLPRIPFYFAGAADLRSPLIRRIIDAEGVPGEAGDNEVPSAFDALGTNMKNADGVAMVVGANKAGFMAGIFVNTVSYIASKDSRAMLGALRESVAGMKDTTVGTTKVKIDYKQDVAEAHGVKFDAWTTTLTFDPNDPNSFMAGMTMQTLFGQGKGFGQMAAAVDGGLVMTMSQNTPLMSNAIASATGGPGLGTDESLAAIRPHLPGKHGLEVYLGSDAILNAVKTTMEDYLGEEIAVPANVPPLGLTAGTEDGVVSMRLFVPARVFEAIASIIKAMEAAEEAPEPLDGSDRGMNGT